MLVSYFTIGTLDTITDFKFRELSDLNGSEQWQGSVFDYSANSTSIIGSILVSPTYGQLGTLASTWDEYAIASVL